MPGIQPGHERICVKTDAACVVQFFRVIYAPRIAFFEEEPVPSEGEPARRGRPRDTAVDQRVLDVACDRLLTGGYTGLDVWWVAARADVGEENRDRRRGAPDPPAADVCTPQ